MVEPLKYGERDDPVRMNPAIAESARRALASMRGNESTLKWRTLDAAGRKLWIKKLKMYDEPQTKNDGYTYEATFTDNALDAMGETPEEKEQIQREIDDIFDELFDEALDLWMTREDRPQPIHQTEMENGVTYLGDFDIRDNIRRELNGRPKFTRVKREPPFFRKVKVSELTSTPTAITFEDDLSVQLVRLSPRAPFTIYNFDEYMKRKTARERIGIFTALQGTWTTGTAEGRYFPPDAAGLIARYAKGGRRTRRARKSKSVSKKRTTTRKRK